MRANIHLLLPSQRFFSKAETIEMSVSTVGQCLQDMFQKFPALQDNVPPTGSELLVDSEKVFSWQSDRLVKDGDELIISSVSGCC